MKILKRKTFRMPISVVGLGDVFFDKAAWQMTINARGGRVVARFLPGIELRLHDMAIGARLWVGAEIGKSFRVMKSVHPDTKQGSKRPPK